jgi:hypothetical protein
MAREQLEYWRNTDIREFRSAAAVLQTHNSSHLNPTTALNAGKLDPCPPQEQPDIRGGKVGVGESKSPSRGVIRGEMSPAVTKARRLLGDAPQSSGTDRLKLRQVYYTTVLASSFTETTWMLVLPLAWGL